MTHETARALFKKNYIGQAELTTLPPPFSFVDVAIPEIPFDDEVLKRHAFTHLLIFTPRGDITINWLRENMGVEPAKEPCMYNQDWYLKEDFAAKTSLDGKWHLIRKEVREDVRAKRPEEIEATLDHERFPSAVTCAFTFFAYGLLTKGEKLWNHDFLWCSDRDHNGDRIYVGRYEDPTGVNKNGFNIHRHLALRPAYSAAPEITN
jgi:hypothetical protein